MIKSALERAAFERMPVTGIMVVDVATRHVTLSREIAPLYAIPVSMAGRPIPVDDILDAVSPADRAPLGELVQRTIATGEVLRVRYAVRDAHGEVRWVSVEGQCFYNAKGEPQSYPVAVRDVTDTIESGSDLDMLGNHLLEALRIATDYRLDKTSELLASVLREWGEVSGREVQ